MRDIDILVIGEVNCDLVLTGDVEPVFGQVEKVIGDATLTVGGSGAIFACAAVRLGLRVAYCGVVGDDTFGRFMMDNLRQRGVDTAGVIVDPSIKTGLSVILSRASDRAILTFLGAISALAAHQVHGDLVARARHLHIASYFLQHALWPGLPDLLFSARGHGTTVSLDTNWDPTERWNHGLEAALAQTDVFLPNEQEALAIAQTATGERRAGPPLLDLLDALANLAQRIPTVAVKLGAHGAICRQGKQVVKDPGFQVEVVDTTGAGDTFNAGFLYGYLLGWAQADSLALACACGALSTQASGGVAAQPSLVEAQSLIQLRNRT